MATEWKKFIDSNREFLINNQHKGYAYCAKKMGRSVDAVRAMAYRIGITYYSKNSEFLTSKDISHMIGIHINTIRKWLRAGLIKCKKTSFYGNMYLIKISDLEYFLKNNQDLWDSRKLKTTIWRNKPNWLKEKIDKDKSREPLYKKWTEAENRKLSSMYNSKRYTREQISEVLGRTKMAVDAQITRLCLSDIKKRWTVLETQKLIKMLKPPKYTYKQIGKKLGRTTKAIKKKVERLRAQGKLPVEVGLSNLLT